MLSLINDVLDMSRIESGKLNLNEKPESLPDIIHTLKDIVQADINAKNLQFFANSIGIHNENVVCDRLRLNQVLLNVISNAIKYTPAGGSIWFSVEQKPSGQSDVAAYEFRIRDSGIGMSEEFLPRIFDAFTRVNSSTVSGIQGTGLGMAITKNIVDMMNGRIKIRSKLDEGTDVVIDFEFKLADSKQEMTRVQELEGKKVLVIDDDMECAKSIPQIFKEIGVVAECCYSGADALDRVEVAKNEGLMYDAFLVDWRMPNMDGLKTIQKLRQLLGDDILVIVMSAYEWADIEDKAVEVGIRNFVSKPIFPSDARNALMCGFGLVKAKVKESDKKVNFNGKKVLLVDDNELNREIAQEILEDCGIVVTTACVQLTIAGIPYSRDTIAAWHKIPPNSVTIPERIANFGVHPVSVNFVTRISPSCNLSISSKDSITLAVPVTIPLFAPSPFIELFTFFFSPLNTLPISFSLI